MGFFAPLLAAGAGAASGAAVAGTSLGVLGGIGTGLLVFGQLAQGISQYQQMKFMSSVEKQQALALEQSAHYQERRMREAAAIRQSQQIASAAGSGIIPYYGSPLQIQIEASRNALEEINAMWFNTRVEMAQAKSRADYYSMSAPMALGSSIISAAGTAVNAYRKGKEYTGEE